MNLLPQTEKEFTDPLYWKRFFENCDASFEWYGSYSKLSSILEKYIKPADLILQIGCGNSNLAEQLHDNGFRHVFSIDVDAQVIAKQKKKHSERRPTLTFECCSADDIGLADCSVNVVIDKGTLDALLPSIYCSSDEKLIDSIFLEIDRCLVPFGRYIVITLAQRHIVRKLIDYFGCDRFIVRLQRCEQTNDDFTMPVFAIVVTKLKVALKEKRPFEFLNSSESPAEILPTFEKISERICAAQQMNWFRHFVSRGPVEETSVKICSLNNAERYELIVVDDRTLKTICKYGAFIVPFGRENDWLFATPKGREILRKNCDLHRLVVIRLFRTQKYGSLDDIQKELNAFILDFMPRTCAGQKINFLSLGSTDVTESIESGFSMVSGKWTVEHVRIQDSIFRRLVFLGSSNLIQSEAEIKKTKSGLWQIDWSDLSCQHHKLMLTALEFLPKRDIIMSRKPLGLVEALDAEIRFALLGLGGGILAKFIHDKFQKSKITAVELDNDVFSIALKHFDFPNQSDRLEVIICDALEFLRENSKKEEASAKFDVILVDLSGSVEECGLYCPPSHFVSKEVLGQMKNCLNNDGVLSLNLVTRDDAVADEVKKTMSEIFPNLYTIRGHEDVNEVIICPLSEFPESTPPTTANNNKKGKKISKKIHTSDPTTHQQPSWLFDCINFSKQMAKFV